MVSWQEFLKRVGVVLLLLSITAAGLLLACIA